MSLLTDIAQNLLAGSAKPRPDQTSSLLQVAFDLLQDEKHGGINGLVSQFKGSGLGDVIASWIGTGQNQPINPDQLSAVLGSERVDALAQQAGVPQEQGASLLSQLLPLLVDQLTPDGNIPQESQLASLGKTVLSGLSAALSDKPVA